MLHNNTHIIDSFICHQYFAFKGYAIIVAIVVNCLLYLLNI